MNILMKILKVSIIVFHIALGLMLIFMYNPPLDIYLKVSDPQHYGLGYSVFQIVIDTIAGMVIGIASIAGAVAFIKEKRWAMYALPLTIFVQSMRIIYSVLTAPPPGEDWGLGGIALFFAFILLVIFVLETVYMIMLGKNKQSN